MHTSPYLSREAWGIIYPILDTKEMVPLRGDSAVVGTAGVNTEIRRGVPEPKRNGLSYCRLAGRSTAA
jgi:hypothetical protein